MELAVWFEFAVNQFLKRLLLICGKVLLIAFRIYQEQVNRRAFEAFVQYEADSAALSRLECWPSHFAYSSSSADVVDSLFPVNESILKLSVKLGVKYMVIIEVLE